MSKMKEKCTTYINIRDTHDTEGPMDREYLGRLKYTLGETKTSTTIGATDSDSCLQDKETEEHVIQNFPATIKLGAKRSCRI